MGDLKNTKLQWNSLLTDKRLRNSGNDGDGRNSYECDYDRIIGSSSVRRLQDKTQVFPLQEDDFPRTRLTHSIEVSGVAKSIGKKVGIWLESEHVFQRKDTEKLEALLQTIGVIHDLGNPPFGHFGETIIQDWFKKFFDEHPQLDISESQKQEFLHFDGNVQNLRIITKLQMLGDEYGANFTFGTLAAIMKYPYSVDTCIRHHKNKYGYYESETNIVEIIRKETGLEENVRHPATYLMEAADDIIYVCDDLEDGVKKGYINWEREYSILRENYNKSQYESIFTYCDDKNEKLLKLNMDSKETTMSEIRFFRNKVQGFLIGEVVDEFKNYYVNIMNGEYNHEDLLERKHNEFIKTLKDITANNCFDSAEVRRLEIMGHKVIYSLMDVFTEALMHRKDVDNKDKIVVKSTKSYYGKIYNMISPNFRYIGRYNYVDKKIVDIQDVSDYDILHIMLDYISGMTDSYALNMYKELNGIV